MTENGDGEARRRHDPSARTDRGELLVLVDTSAWGS